MRQHDAEQNNHHVPGPSTCSGMASESWMTAGRLRALPFGVAAAVRRDGREGSAVIASHPNSIVRSRYCSPRRQS